MRRVVGYLSKTSDVGLFYRSNGGTLVTRIYADASWAAPRSQSGAALVEESDDGASLAMFDWTSVKQSITADSSGASEIIAAHTAIRVHIAQACAFGVSSLVEVYTDNSTVVRIAEKGTSQQLAWLQMKPIAVRMGLLQDFVNLGIAKIKPVRTDRQKGDGFTKALDRVKLDQWRRLTGLGKDCSELDVSPPLQSQIQPKTPKVKVAKDAGEVKALAKVMALKAMAKVMATLE
jgi:16S rRNA U1498 N3-methylase RsmE